jgi:hypothetical protein
MGEILECFVGFVLDVASCLVEIIFPGFLEADTWLNRILWGRGPASARRHHLVGTPMSYSL